MSPIAQNIPPQLTFAENPKGLSTDDLATGMLGEGKAVLLAGLSLLGSVGYIVRCVSIIQGLDFDENGQAAQIRGWNYYDSHPEESKRGVPSFFDSRHGELTDLAIPNTMIYVVGSVADEVLTGDYPPEELQKIYDCVIPLVSDG